MSDFERTAQTMAVSPDFNTLRDELVRAIDQMEADALPIEEFPGHLMKLAVALSLPLAGPAETIAGMSALLAQIGTTWPDAWTVAKARLQARCDA